MQKRTKLWLSAALTGFAMVLAAGAFWQWERPTINAAASTAANSAQVDAQQPVTAQSNGASMAVASSVSPQDAVQIALRALPNSTLQRGPELVNYQGANAYAMQLSRGIVLVDSANGNVLYTNGQVRSSDRQQPASRISDHNKQSADHEYGEDDD